MCQVSYGRNFNHLRDRLVTWIAQIVTSVSRSMPSALLCSVAIEGRDRVAENRWAISLAVLGSNAESVFSKSIALI